MIPTFLLLILFCIQQVYAVIVKTPLGAVQGFHVDYGTNTSALFYGSGDIFLGIPFAEPPLADLRFAKPVPISNYTSGGEPWNATFYRNACAQVGGCGSTHTKHSEDCLYLNVFSPDVNSSKKYPVMVFIHGGSFTTGCAQEYPYKGGVRSFVSREVLTVTIQYRLGFHGFFTTFTDEFPPNRGLLDQISALRWVRSNIAFFGGDPNKVTIFGESAGACSVSAHTYSPVSQGLFEQGILESGSVLTCFGDNASSREQARELCGTDEEQWAKKDFGPLSICLKNKTMDDLLEHPTGWGMVQDDFFLPEPVEVLARKRTNRPMLIGNMRDEYAYFALMEIKFGQLHLENITRKFVEDFFLKTYAYMGEKTEEVLAVLEKVYIIEKNVSDSDGAAWLRISSDIFTGAAFTAFMIRDADYFLENGNPSVYLWEQSYASNVSRLVDLPLGDWNPVPHCSELYFMWIPEETWTHAIESGTIAPFDFEMADWYADSWTNFAKSGVPSSDGSWRPISREYRGHFKVDKMEESGLQMHDGYRHTDDVLWNRVIPAILEGRSTPKADNSSRKTSIGSLFLFIFIFANF